MQSVQETQGNQSLKVLRRLWLLLLQSDKGRFYGQSTRFISLVCEPNFQHHLRLPIQLQAPRNCSGSSKYRCKMGIVKMKIGFHLTVFV